MKKGFCDGYKTYDPEVEGYGNASQWRDAFNERMGWEEATIILGDTDPYTILELQHNATFEEIKKQYRKMAKKWHPDKNPDNPEAEAKFKEAAEAYDVLSTPDKKSNYDRFGSAEGGGGNPFGGFGGGQGHGFNMNDIFNQFGDIFGGGFGGEML